MGQADLQSKVQQAILQHVPREVEITRIEFEGPRIAVYTKKPEILVDQSRIVTEIVNLIRKRITIRSDPSVRMHENEAEQFIKTTVPQNAEITNITFDPMLGEVIIEAKKPGLVIYKEGAMLQEIIKTTKWRPHVLRTPQIPSKIIAHIRHYYYTEVKAREKILRSVGERIFRPTFSKSGEVLITTLGGFQQVGRSCILLRTKESSVLLDTGIHPATSNPEESYPRFDINEFNLENLDAVIISHAHLDHSGILPLLYKYGYDGPVYATEPTISLSTLLQLDYLDVLKREGNPVPFDQKDVKEAVLHTIPTRYGVVTDVAPDIRMTLHNAGHILGSSVIHLHIGEGLHNIVYTGDFKFMPTMLLEAATTNFPRVETLIMESTYGAPENIMPSRVEMEQKLARIINDTLNRGGKVLIPTMAVGRAQEVMLVIADSMKRGVIKEVSIFIEGMINEVTGIHTAYPEYLSKELQNKILYEDVNPFQSEYFNVIKHPDARPEIIEGPPCIIMATSGMLEGGPVMDYFRHLAPDPKNSLIFVNYQIEGTLGSRLQRGLGEVSLMNGEGRLEAISVKMDFDVVEGFSGHSDRNQLLNYIKRINPKPQRVIVGHGEKSKCLNLAATIRRVFNTEAQAPTALETLRLV